jgi:hypothetical protein
MLMMCSRSFEGVWIEPRCTVFIRGRRLDPAQVRRMQGQLWTLLRCFGLNCREIQGLPACCPRQSRNRAKSSSLRSVEDAIDAIAVTASVRHGGWRRHTRDAVLMLLHFLGADHEDIAVILRMPPSWVTIARRIHGLPAAYANTISRTAFQTLRRLGGRIERMRSEPRQKCTRKPRTEEVRAAALERYRLKRAERLLAERLIAERKEKLRQAARSHYLRTMADPAKRAERQEKSRLWQADFRRRMTPEDHEARAAYGREYRRRRKQQAQAVA